jgi:hypothetical protein
MSAATGSTTHEFPPIEVMTGRNSYSETGQASISAIAPVASAVEPAFPGQRKIGYDRIRLLDILPGGPDDPICARLFSVSLSESPAYEALSYTWGDLSRVKEIQVSHESSKEEGTSSSSTSIVPTGVTSNCYAALRRLRQGATDRSRTVWIYSICINQANIDEKNHQLTLMKRSYEKASCVVVYLGEHADDSDKAMDWIQEIDTPSGYAGTSGDETELLDLNLDKSIMEALFCRPWFRRV